MQKVPKFGQIKNEKIEFHFQNKKIIVYNIKFQKCFKPDPDPKNSPKAQKIVLKGPKNCKRAPNVTELKQKDRAVLPKAKLRVYIDPEKVFEPDPNQKKPHRQNQ